MMQTCKTGKAFAGYSAYLRKAVDLKENRRVFADPCADSQQD